MKKMVTGVLALVMVLVMVGCGQKDNGVVNGVAKDGATIGEGAKSFTMEVVDKDGGKVTFTVKTDADTVGKALLDQGVIQDPSTKEIVYNLAQQDMVALRVVMRMGWALPNPATRLNADRSKVPFAFLTAAAVAA